jgi:CRISPR/Cas system-associated exonuclease Cas4 (RecB family)
MPEDNGMISASEMSEFEFCNVSWYLNKEGYPRSSYSSARMQRGVEMHRRVQSGYSNSGGAIKILLILFFIIAGFAVYLYLGGSFP